MTGNSPSSASLYTLPVRSRSTNLRVTLVLQKYSNKRPYTPFLIAAHSNTAIYPQIPSLFLSHSLLHYKCGIVRSAKDEYHCCGVLGR